MIEFDNFEESRVGKTGKLHGESCLEFLSRILPGLTAAHFNRFNEV